MKAVILTAGEGTRLRPFTNSEPKGMLSIANRPILEYIIEALAQNKIRDIIMVVGYQKERIMSYFEDGKDLNVKISYIVQRKSVGKVGTAYALSMAKKKVKDDLIVLPGDNLIDARTVEDIIKGKEKYKVAIVQSDIPSKYGVVELRGNVIRNITEKPTDEISNLISTGIYKLPPSIFDDISKVMDMGKYDMTSVLQYIIPKRKVTAVLTHGLWQDVVYPWDLVDTNSLALKGAGAHTSGRIERHVILKGPVTIGKGSIVRSGSYIVGPVIIGDGCEIGPNVVIHPSTSIGNNVRIGPNSVIEHSVIMSDVNMGASAHISNSVICEGVEMGPQFCATSRSTNIEMDNELHKVEHIGALIGERTIIGDQVSIIGGTIIGSNCNIASHKVISSKLPDNSRIL